MANLRLKQVFGRWSDDNKVKAFNAIADDDLKSMLASDKEKAFETFKNKLGEEEFNAAFDSYYQTIKPAKKETSNEGKRVVVRRTPELIDKTIKGLEKQIEDNKLRIEKLKVEKEKLIEAEKFKNANKLKKQFDKMTDEEKAFFLNMTSTN